MSCVVGTRYKVSDTEGSTLVRRSDSDTGERPSNKRTVDMNDLLPSTNVL